MLGGECCCLITAPAFLWATSHGFIKHPGGNILIHHLLGHPAGPYVFLIPFCVNIVTEYHRVWGFSNFVVLFAAGNPSALVSGEASCSRQQLLPLPER